MFSCLNCCDSAEADKHEATHVADPHLDEGRAEVNAITMPVMEATPSPNFGKGLVPHALTSPRTSEASAPSTAGSLASEEKQREKKRLQDMVKDFAKTVVHGQPCQWLDDGAGGKPRTSVYSIDQALKVFHLKAEDCAPQTLQMIQIREILWDINNTSLTNYVTCPELSQDDLEKRFVCIQHVSDTKMQYMGLLMPDAYERDRFYTCMKVLRWAMEFRKPNQ
eukprot:gnl/MRDRNA2_/MRDRNA2_34326_c0_seq1.p1 gnl/MRDRNA2_/MRDRNA2_34326_c0~~gnl/MRDRNA2_/MRDRNA2_34326_c0_seq1.p1  ORF type:complete len:222 (+),score=53.83 gnl/MRDRNA2_/MRDRNA2_34326_c0_seq1:97-762(+)